jgi:DNA-binding Lrp family transcriptional regulator
VLALDELDRRLLNIVQARFPLVPAPYREIGQLLGISGTQVIHRLQCMKEQRILRQISAIFDTRAMGYKSSLVAVKAPPNQVDQVAEVINQHPGVSHNYRRNHEFNLWYTIAVPPASSLEATVEALNRLSGALASRILPTLRLFKIGVELDMEGSRPLDARSEPHYSEDKRSRAAQLPLTEQDVAIVRELQEDLPLIDFPFRAIAEKLGMTEGQLFRHISQLMETGRMRRLAGILYHRQAGFKANPMAVWAVPPERTHEVGTIMASFTAVSHCYQRPTYPDWPYNIFTMVHGRSARECQEVIKAIANATGVTDYLLLYSSKEYKKVRLRLFVPEFDAWERKYLTAAGSPIT